MTIKGEQKVFKLQNYEILINPISEKKIHIEAVDISQKIQFAEPELVLENIGAQTLILALQGKRKEITVTPSYKKEGQFELLQLKVKIESPFLKTIQESIFIKKFRNVEEFQIIDKRLKSVGQKLRNVKQDNGERGVTLYNFQPQEQTFNGAGYQTLSSIRLNKGKYLITFSFLLKATNQWIYLYMNQGEAIVANSGYYVPTTTYWMPFTVRVVKTVSQDNRDMQFTTQSASSYPVMLKNRIITAQKLND